MRIIYLITQGECGGAQKNVLDHALGAIENGHKVFVITGKQENAKDGWLFDELRKKVNSCQLIEVPLLQREINFRADIKAFVQLFTLFQTLKPHIIHVHSTKAGILGCIAGKLAGSKIVYTVHGFVFSEPLSMLRKFFYIFVEYFVSFFRDITITVSFFDKKNGEKYRIINDKNSVVIYNGIDPARAKGLPGREDARRFLNGKCHHRMLESESIWIGTVANLYETKGITHLIDAACILRDKNMCINFFVIGEGELRRELEKKIHAQNLSHMFFLVGSIPNAYQYLKAFDLIVLPSVKEGFPYILIESLLAEVPFVATHVGGVSELKNFINARVIPPSSAPLLAQAIHELVTQKTQDVPALPNEFTLEHMLTKTFEQYDSVLPLYAKTDADSFLITLPAFNEEKIISESIKKVTTFLEYRYKDLIVSGKMKVCIAINGSNDATERIVEELEGKINYLRHTTITSKGRGAALRYTWSNSEEDVLMYIDSDLAYSMEDLAKMIDSHLSGENYDMVVASRRIKGSVVVRSAIRNILTEGYNRIVALMFLNGFSDAQAGCKSIKRDVYWRIHKNLQNYDGWFFDTALLLYCEKNGGKIHDIAITCIDKRQWRLHIFVTILYFFKNLILLRFKTYLFGWSR